MLDRHVAGARAFEDAADILRRTRSRLGDVDAIRHQTALSPTSRSVHIGQPVLPHDVGDELPICVSRREHGVDARLPPPRRRGGVDATGPVWRGLAKINTARTTQSAGRLKSLPNDNGQLTVRYCGVRSFKAAYPSG